MKKNRRKFLLSSILALSSSSALAKGLFPLSGKGGVSTTPPPPTPVITVSPSSPSIPDTTPTGTVVATVLVTMSDSSPFTGTLNFVAPNFDSGGIFALQMTDLAHGSIIVNPSGPGVGPNTGDITDHITLEALQ